jgi:hypothetical protein
MMSSGPVSRVRLWGSALALVSAAAAAAPPAHADEPLFGFIYTTDLLPKGKWEIEQWSTLKSQKAGGDFYQIDERTEISYGVTSNFQLSAYANYSFTYSYLNAPDGTTTASEQFSDFSVDPGSIFQASRFVGLSLEGIYRVMSPYKDPFGLALYFEPTFGPNFFELEGKIILHKNFLDDRLVMAFNFTWAPEVRPPLPAPNNVETDINMALGVSYRFAENWNIGWEFLNEREMNGWDWWNYSNWTNSGFYTGPTLHYANQRFFFTLTALEQLPWGVNYQDPGLVVNGHNFDVDFEQYRVRLKLGWVF